MGWINGDDGSKLKSLGVGTVAALAILYMTFGFLTDIGVVSASKRAALPPKVDRMTGQVDDLHEWHSQKDSDGIPVWYVPRSMNSLLRDLLEGQREQIALMRLQLEIQKDRERVR